jgi:hypothetical protein
MAQPTPGPATEPRGASNEADQSGRPSHPREVVVYHVPDCCVTGWHNPACPLLLQTWLFCDEEGTLCKCIHKA